jgi:hypothetical protein
LGVAGALLTAHFRRGTSANTSGLLLTGRLVMDSATGDRIGK